MHTVKNTGKVNVSCKKTIKQAFMCVLNRKNFNKSAFSRERCKSVVIIRAQLREFFVGNWILNECVAISVRKKSFDFSFWWINRNLCTFMKNFTRKFFVADWILNKCVATRGRKKSFEFSFWRISRNLCTFIRNFVRKFFVGNWISDKCVVARGLKKSFEFRFWWISRNLCTRFVLKILNKSGGGCLGLLRNMLLHNIRSNFQKTKSSIEPFFFKSRFFNFPG